MRYTSFDKYEVNPDWCFNNVRSVEQWTHGYHRYPAKFLPNLVKKLIEEKTCEGDTIVDLFAGCGTTLVESKIHGRKSMGVDINPVAELITRVKTKPIDPERLKVRFDTFIERFNHYDDAEYRRIATHDRIDYWFCPKHKRKVAFMYREISSMDDKEVRDFLLVSLSHILKNSSRWLQSSTKPQIDPQKKPVDPFSAFRSHTLKMLEKNMEYYTFLMQKGYSDLLCEIKKGDARNTYIEADSIDAIITSPPYVTSYEYADIHQLTGYWYEYMSDLADFRKRFIGTFYSLNQNTECCSDSAGEIVQTLLKCDVRTAKEVANYFNDMEMVGREMYRILKEGGHTCIVVGNTTLKGVNIRSAEVLYEILVSVGFKEVMIIRRSIPNKLMPTIRDEKTGRFSSLDNENYKLIYPDEYIIIMQK
jgi:DNA modification methylase